MADPIQLPPTDTGRPPCRLSFQTTLPDDYAGNADFNSLLALLRELGFWGVELNIVDPSAHDFAALGRHLAAFGLKFSMLATGLTARLESLSLSSPDETVRKRSVTRTRQMIEWIQGTDTGIIIGLLKGGPAGDRAAAIDRFSRSLADLAPVASPRGVHLLVEATNRYETAVANTLDEAATLVAPYDARHLGILPDTFHMNIEESAATVALAAHLARIPSIHLSDNNRRFPGFGALDFSRIISDLNAMGYRGRLAIEGNPGDLAGDLHHSAAVLAPLLGLSLQHAPHP